MPATDSIPGVARTFHKRFKFIVSGSDFNEPGAAGFMTAGPLVGEVAVITTYEGGALIPNKSPGRLNFPDVVFTRGVTKDLNLYTWFQQACFSSQLVKEADLKRPLTIAQLDRSVPGTDASAWLRAWTLFGAWPVRFEAGEWDADADEATVESLTIAYDFFELVVNTDEG